MNGVSRFFNGSSNKFQGVSIGSQGCYNSVSRKFLGDSKVLGVSSKFQGCFQSVSKNFMLLMAFIVACCAESCKSSSMMA